MHHNDCHSLLSFSTNFHSQSSLLTNCFCPTHSRNIIPANLNGHLDVENLQTSTMTTTTKDPVALFEDELQSITQSEPPISTPKMDSIKKAAIRGIKQYKLIVHSVEKFISGCEPKYKLPSLHVITSIVRQSVHQFGPERDVYVARFSKNLSVTVEKAINDCIPSDRSTILKILKRWQNEGTFPSKILKPIASILNKVSTSNISLKDDKYKDLRRRHQTAVPGTRPNAGHHSVGANPSPSQKELFHQGNSLADTNAREDPPLNTVEGLIPYQQNTVKSEANLIDSSIRGDDDSLGLTDKVGPNRRVSEDCLSSARSMESDNFEYDILLTRTSKGSGRLSRTPSSKSSRDERPKRPKVELATLETSIPDIIAQPQIYPTEQYETRRSAQSQSNPLDSSLQNTLNMSERQRRCLPPLRAGYLTVCSSTLWVGHMPKAATESDLSDVFGMFGIVESIDMIPSRGCAYVCMNRRQDAFRIIEQSENIRLIKNKIRLSWAPGKGFYQFDRLKDFWEKAIGASYIPYNEIDSSIDLDTLEEGGTIDDESATSEMQQRRKRTRGTFDTIAAPIAPNMIPPELFLLQQQQQQQQQLLSSAMNISQTRSSFPIPPSSMAFPPVGQQAENQLSQLLQLSQLPNSGPIERDYNRGSVEQQQQLLNSIFRIQASLPPHLMFNNLYVQGLAALHGQTNNLQLGADIVPTSQPAPSGQVGGLLHSNHSGPRREAPSTTSTEFMFPFQSTTEMMQYLNATPRK